MIRYLIEWHEAVQDERNDNWFLIPVGEVHREIFDDECKFNERLTQLQNYKNGVIEDVIIDGIYTCELQRITSR